MKRLKLPATTLTVLGLSMTSIAQEVASGGRDLQADTAAIAQMMDAKNAAVMVILQKLTTCNAKHGFYQPDDPSADDEGCTTPVSSSSERIWSGNVADATNLSLATGKRFSNYASITMIGGPSHRPTMQNVTTVPVAIFKAKAAAGFLGTETFSGDDSGHYAVRYVDETHFSTDSDRRGRLIELWGNR